jgi:hypothetical protein
MEDPTEGPAPGNASGQGATPADILAELILGGGEKKIHEIGVQGSVIEQSVNLVEKYSRVEPIVVTSPDDLGVPAFVTREGVEVVQPDAFDSWRTQPRFRKGSATMFDVASFIGHVKRFKDANSMIFANNDFNQPSMTAVLDYHPAGAESEPRFGHHRTNYRFPLDDKWKLWHEFNGKSFSMVDFAHFLESNITDVMPADYVSVDGDDELGRFMKLMGGKEKIADPSVLMSIATGLEVNENSTVSENTKLASGEGLLTFQSTHETKDATGAKIKVPTMFALALPVFRNDQPWQVIARLRYRHRPSLTFSYELWESKRVFDKAFDEVVQRVQNQTETTVWLGSPE